MEQDLRVVKTRRIIRSTFMGLLSEKPMAGITISELCLRAQINRKTFYRHYTALEDVAAELENEMLDEFSHGFGGESISGAGAVIANVGRVIGQRLDFYRKLMCHNPDTFNNGRLREALCRMIFAVEKNRNPDTDEQTLKAACDFVVSGVFALYAEWFENGGDWDFISELSVRLAENAIAGL
ncbi:MAG: TetR/AcrR family transcriptional regulator [Oscillospiraceae bacterium]